MILVINDLHFAEQPPSIRTPEYFRHLSLKLLECSKVEAKYCDFTVITGDVFHHKVARNVTHRTVRVLISILKRFKKVYLVPGNHDILGGQHETKSRQPIGVLLESGCVELVVPLFWPGYGFNMIPLGYSEKFEAGQEEFMLPTNGQPTIVFAHSMLSPGSPLRKKIKGEFKKIFYGHPHMPEGDVDNFVNFGALARTRADAWDKRAVAVAILERDFTAKRYELQTQLPWQDVFIQKEKEDEPSGAEFLDAFVRALEAETVSVDQDLNSLMKTLDPKVRSRLEYYLGSL